MAKYRKKPVEVEAMQFFTDGPSVPGVYYDSNMPHLRRPLVVTIHDQDVYLQDGDWVITEPDGEHHYPCKPDIFEATYEVVK